MAKGEGEVADPFLDRSVRLFEFLGQAQRLKGRPVRHIESYEREGQVVWFHHLPDHPSVRVAEGELAPDAPVLIADRVPRSQPPPPPASLQEWLDRPINRPADVPGLRDSRIRLVASDEPEVEAQQETLQLDDFPEVRQAYDTWLPVWRSWAASDIENEPARDMYGRLFSIYVASTSHPEELEMVVGIGCLGWQTAQQEPVRRHLVTAAATVDFDDATGQLTVRTASSADAATVETEMVEPAQVADPQRVQEVRNEARDLAVHLMDRDQMEPLLRRLVHSLHPEATYGATAMPPLESDRPHVTYAPALILRKRSQQGLIEIFDTIVAQLREAAVVPDGLRPLVDPDHTPASGGESTAEPGALVEIDNEPFLPLPVNEQQLRIIRKVDTEAQVLVQGPPGTGKTHTAAALIAHLLAQGKRVLVTAQTERALKEVREKLPEQMKPLSVAVVGASREDMSDLKVAVERIGQYAADYDPVAVQRAMDQMLNEIDGLRRRRAELQRALIAAREQEVCTHHRGDFVGTLAVIALQYAAMETEFGWIRDLAPGDAETTTPVAGADAVQWHQGLVDAELLADRMEARQSFLASDEIPRPDDFAGLASEEAAAVQAVEETNGLHQHPSFAALLELPGTTRRGISDSLHELAAEADFLAARREQWMNTALLDIAAGKAAPWRDRRTQISQLIQEAEPLVAELGPLTQVCVRAGQSAPLVPLAEGLLAHLQTGGKVKAELSGKPKIGALTNRTVKQAAPLFELVTVDGVPPVSEAALHAFLIWNSATRCLDALERAWPAEVQIPAEDTLRERLTWHAAELASLDRLLILAERLEAEDARLVSHGVPSPDWTDLHDVRTFAELTDAADAVDALTRAIEPLTDLAKRLLLSTQRPDAAEVSRSLYQAVLQRDPSRYAVAHARLVHLQSTRERLDGLDQIGDRLRLGAPRLYEAVLADVDLPAWPERLWRLDAAWGWASVGAWLKAQEQIDINGVQEEMRFVEDRIHRGVTRLAATRAWGHAVAADRLTGQARADLQQYAGLVRRLGKGTGKYAGQRRRDIRQAMDRCRSSVPVWIMPIYRIAEQLRISENMFDVVIVDEASQAGLEATFLQYLAPKIVVIGDDRQVSPAAVGIDQQRLRDLAQQYLHDNRHRATWEDPKRSLFDEAVMRFGGRITLVEHRRCVPEIIGFSNRIAYEPDGVRLIPVRQYRADRLQPIRMVFLPDGYTRGESQKTNPVEVDAIVDQILKCVAEPRYDGLSFGVISLQGVAQARAIEKRLLDALPPEEWLARDLRCGDSADFQGSERDVIFLSMVAAPEPGKRLRVASQEGDVQRFNVAASRAKDQMWVFHSVALDDIAHTADVRFQLLDYCSGVIDRTSSSVDGAVFGPVPEDARVEPFESLFEQRVCNRLTDRGYTVVPQFPVEGRRIDLVVVGSQGNLAIECDGDTWHGPGDYENDLRRQRDLERCGWTFFRIRESDFYVDRAAALVPLWELLASMGIHPSGWAPASPALAEPLAASAALGRRTYGPGGKLGNATPAPDENVGLRSAPHSVTTSAFLVGDEGTSPIRSDSDDEADTALGSLLTGSSIAGFESASTGGGRAGRCGLLPYQPFDGALSPAAEANREELIAGIREIVTVEGPVMGSRLHHAYVRASGGRRVGSQIARALNSAVTAAVRGGVLIEDAPLGEVGVQPKTYRLAGQVAVSTRDLGPRDFGQIPPRELAQVLSGQASLLGWSDVDELYRAVLACYGLKRLTPGVRQRLESVCPMVLSADA